LGKESNEERIRGFINMDYGQMRRIAVDPKVVDLIQRSPSMSYEQGSDFMSGWGGPQQYKQLARLPVEQRLCLAAVREGVTTEDQLGIVTGLSPEQVSRGILGLQNKGLVTIEKAV